MFEDFKSKFNKQNKQKKDELKKLFSSSKIKEDNIINIKDDKGSEKLEVNAKSLLELIKTMVIVAGNHNEDVLQTIHEQFEKKENKKPNN